MISVLEAQKIILESVQPLGRETLPLERGLGRFFACEVFAPIPLPPFDNSAMDGFAVRSADTEGASPGNPVRLQVVGSIAAGDALTLHLNPWLQDPSPDSGEGSGDQGNQLRVRAVRIMTGAPIPPGADAVIPFEETVSVGADLCVCPKPIRPGYNIRRAGEDLKYGEPVFNVGEPVTSRAIALLAALGLDRVAVFKKPLVKIIVTGNELINGGMSLPPGKIFNSNGPALAAALREIGIEPAIVTTATDSEEDLIEKLRRHLDADVLITAGGVSMGDLDLVPHLLERIGARIFFHKVSVKPGKPLLFATFERKLIFSLPGNPVSSWVVFDHFVRSALLKMMGARSAGRERREVIAEETIKGSRRFDLLRGLLRYQNGTYHVRSAGGQGSAILKSLSMANCLILLPEEVTAVSAGEKVMVEIL